MTGLRGAPLVLIEGAAHLPNLEQPAAFNPAPLEHLTHERSEEFAA